MNAADASPLRRALSETAAQLGIGLKDLTVLAPQNDPFRVDTPARHRDGEWLAINARDLGLGERKIHLRGLHYALIGRAKPDGTTPYANTDDDWGWLQNDAAKAARWLGYVPFDQIVDHRNAAPIVRMFQRPDPWPYITVGLDVHIPRTEDIMPRIGVADFTGVQPHKLVLWGEKSSLAEVLGPIAQDYSADLYLPTGEISDTLLYQMATVGAEDGRPMIVFCFSDADPSGWQMPVSIGRKLQALREGWYPRLGFEVHRVALTPDQVTEHGLPSTPLKPTEKRADKWRQEMQVDQTEIDALASLQPDLLDRIARDALQPYYDATLARRVAEAHRRWQTEAQDVVNAALDGPRLSQIRADAATKLAALREEIDAINDALRIDADDFDLPVPEVPTAAVPAKPDRLPLISSRWSFAEQCRRLRDSKAYREDGDT